MSKEFVRTIKKTNLGGNKLSPNNEQKEPLYTNVQNDLLSDDKDVFVRNGKDYHCLTDNLKTVNSTNDVTTISTKNKNEIDITVKKVIIESNDDYIVIDKESKNDEVIFKVGIDLPEIYVDIVNQLKEDGYITDPEEGEQDE